MLGLSREKKKKIKRLARRGEGRKNREGTVKEQSRREAEKKGEPSREEGKEGREREVFNPVVHL